MVFASPMTVGWRWRWLLDVNILYRLVWASWEEDSVAVMQIGIDFLLLLSCFLMLELLWLCLSEVLQLVPHWLCVLASSSLLKRSFCLLAMVGDSRFELLLMLALLLPSRLFCSPAPAVWCTLERELRLTPKDFSVDLLF